jgi:hypothetical protein
MRQIVLSIVILGLAGCAEMGLRLPGNQSEPTAGRAAAPQPEAGPEAAVEPTPPVAAGNTAEALDTTSKEDRAEAASAAGGTRLGRTTASLGDVTEPGFWIKTPLADTVGQGRVENPATGQSAQVDLIPLEGPATAGSRLSLSAMRLIGAALTDLPEVVVYAN